MIIDNDIIQGTEPWFKAHAGKVSPSQLHRIITPEKLEISKQRDELLDALEFEYKVGRMLGWGESAATRRGQHYEPEARRLFEWLNHVSIKEVGICYMDETRRVAFSPDGLYEDETSGLEIKCRSIKYHREYVKTKNLQSKDKLQCQGYIYCSGYETWQFFAFHPEVPPEYQFHKVVEPISKYQKAIHSALWEFCDELDERINNG